MMKPSAIVRGKTISVDPKESPKFKAIIDAIVSRQGEFFLLGMKHLKPMTYKCVGLGVGLNQSTVYRLIVGTYIETDFGIFQIKDLFCSGAIKTNQGELSSVSVREVMKQHLHMTDNELHKFLNDSGIFIALRTVNHYRHKLSKEQACKPSINKTLPSLPNSSKNSWVKWLV